MPAPPSSNRTANTAHGSVTASKQSPMRVANSGRIRMSHSAAAFRIRNAGLLTTPAISADQR